MSLPDTIGMWIAVFGTLACWSFLYKDNRVFHAVESLFIGTAAAYQMVYALDAVRTIAIDPLVLKGQIVYVIPLVLGFLYLARVHPKFSWPSRYPIALLIGVGFGLATRTVLQVNLLRQIASAVTIISSDPMGLFSTLVTVAGTLGGVAYFLFTYQPKGGQERIFRTVTRFGRIILMVAFGAMYGNTILGRASLLIGRLQFILWDFLHLR